MQQLYGHVGQGVIYRHSLGLVMVYLIMAITAHRTSRNIDTFLRQLFKTGTLSIMLIVWGLGNRIVAAYGVFANILSVVYLLLQMALIVDLFTFVSRKLFAKCKIGTKTTLDVTVSVVGLIVVIMWWCSEGSGYAECSSNRAILGVTVFLEVV